MKLRRTLSLTLALTFLLLGAGCTTKATANELPAETSSQSSPAPDPGDTSVLPEPPEIEEPEPETTEPQPAAYDFSQPVPESEAVDNSYFEDAALSATPAPMAL